MKRIVAHWLVCICVRSNCLTGLAMVLVSDWIGSIWRSHPILITVLLRSQLNADDLLNLSSFWINLSVIWRKLPYSLGQFHLWKYFPFVIDPFTNRLPFVPTHERLSRKNFSMFGFHFYLLFLFPICISNHLVLYFHYKLGLVGSNLFNNVVIIMLKM